MERANWCYPRVTKRQLIHVIETFSLEIVTSTNNIDTAMFMSLGISYDKLSRGELSLIRLDSLKVIRDIMPGII